MEPRDLSRSLLEAWSNRDWDTIRSAMHPEYVYTGPDGEVAAGVEDGLRAGWIGFAEAFPDGQWKITNVAVDGDVILTEFTFRGTHTGPLDDIEATGNTVEAEFCNLMELKDGKLYRERDYFDTLKFFGQLGVVQLP